MLLTEVIVSKFLLEKGKLSIALLYVVYVLRNCQFFRVFDFTTLNSPKDISLWNDTWGLRRVSSYPIAQWTDDLEFLRKKFKGNWTQCSNHCPYWNGINSTSVIIKYDSRITSFGDTQCLVTSNPKNMMLAIRFVRIWRYR